MKKVFIAFMLGLFALAIAPAQSMAYAAATQHEVAVINQPGNAVDLLQVSPLSNPAFALVDMPDGKQICMAGLFAFADETIVTDNADEGKSEQLNESDNEVKDSSTILQILTANWGELLIALLAFVKIVVRLTPSIKDDKIFGWLDSLISAFVPNYESKKE